jgi:hypothetical protein
LAKLIRVAAVAFLAWAITTFAWAAISHVTGVTGPAEASGESLDFVASAVTFVDPPGVLGAPQRFAAQQIRQAADAVERIHHGPERFAARLMDELGHRHKHGRRGHRDRYEVRLSRDIGQHTAEAVERALQASGFAIPIDELDRSRARAEARAVIELNRHRQQADQSRRRIEIRRELNDHQRERIQREIERVTERLERLNAEENGEWRKELGKKLRDILKDLEHELGNVRVINLDNLEELQEMEFELSEGLQDLHLEVKDLNGDESAVFDEVVRIHVRDNR